MATRSQQSAGYAERLWVPWWWWLLAGLTVAILGAEVHIGLGTLTALVTYAVLGVATAALLLRWAFPVTVDARALTVAGRELPRAQITEVQVIPKEQARRLLADHPDASAVVLLRGYAPQVVFVASDGSSDVPGYLLFSSRHPDELAAALEDAP